MDQDGTDKEKLLAELKKRLSDNCVDFTWENTSGMENSIDIEKEAVACGYYPLFHYKPGEDFVLDSKNVNFDDYPVFIERQTRFNALKKVNPSEADKLLEYNILEAKKRFYYYENLAKK